MQLDFAGVVDIRHHAKIGLSIVHDVILLGINFLDVLIVIITI